MSATTNTDPYVVLTKKRSDICYFFNRTKFMWTVQVLDMDDPGLVLETFQTLSLEVVQPSYTLEASGGKLRAFGILKRRKDKDEIQITNF